MFWILRLGKTFRELMADMNFGQWVERIYGENDFGRGIATSIAGSAGLAAYLYWGDWVIAAFVGIIIFPIGRILASAIHSRWIRSQERSDNYQQMAELFKNLGLEEREVVQAFIWHGGSVVTWGDVNRSSHFPSGGIESLINRGLIHPTVTADGMTEAFALDTQLFDYGQTVLPNNLPF